MWVIWQKVIRTLKSTIQIKQGSRYNHCLKLPPPLSFKQAVDSMKKGVDLAVERHGRRNDIQVHSDHCLILTSASDLSYIIEELVDNALKFSREGSPIEVRLENTGILQVVDSGRGMQAEEIEQIGAFRQFDRKNFEQQGLGLGLILVKLLAERNGATLNVSSLPQRGTQDRVRFQLATS